MIQILKAPDHVLALSLQGEISADDVAQMKRAAQQKLGAHAEIGIVVDFTGFSDATEAAIREDIRFEFGLLGQIQRFPRVACITDKQWMGMAMSYAGKLLPTMEMKVFLPAKQGEAIAWSAALPPRRTEKDAQAIKRIPTDRKDVYAFEVDGVVTAAEMPAITAELDRFLKEHQKVRMLVRVKHFAFDPSILAQPGLFSIKIAAMQKLDRYAVVGAPPWMQKAVEVVNPLFPAMEIRTFASDKESEAWAFIEANLLR
ncbi:MAG: STAS/SEC14 domain-containing protein [Burkholderiales bacterium]|nr:STAS/SEC14 domain-containing protein [Burkholderiales bacterium]